MSSLKIIRFSNYIVFVIILTNSIKAQTLGTWNSKLNVGGIYSSNYTFSIGDSVYIGSSSRFYLYDRPSNALVPRNIPVDLISTVNCSFSINGKGYILANLVSGIRRVYEFNPVTNA